MVVTAAAVAVDTGEAVEAAATEVEVEVMEAAETTATGSATTDTKTIRYPSMSPKLSQLHKPPPHLKLTSPYTSFSAAAKSGDKLDNVFVPI